MTVSFCGWAATPKQPTGRRRRCASRTGRHTGNPGLAAGGSGDVLAGMLVSLLGQHIMPLEAAAAAAWLHGAAAELAAQELGEYGMVPEDLLLRIPRLLP